MLRAYKDAQCSYNGHNFTEINIFINILWKHYSASVLGNRRILWGIISNFTSDYLIGEEMESSTLADNNFLSE